MIMGAKMKLFGAVLAAGILATGTAYSQERECLTTDEEISAALQGVDVVEDIAAFISDKWVQLDRQKIEFSADGTTYHMKKSLGSEDEGNGRRWKGNYTVATQDGIQVLCFRTSLEPGYENECAGLAALPPSGELITLMFECRKGDAYGIRLEDGYLTPIGMHEKSPDFIRNGTFVDDGPDTSGSEGGPESEYMETTVIDLKVDIGQLHGRKVVLSGPVSYIAGNDASMSDPNVDVDFSAINIDISRLSRDERKYIISECHDRCNLTVKGTIGEVMFLPGIIADSIDR